MVPDMTAQSRKCPALPLLLLCSLLLSGCAAQTYSCGYSRSLENCTRTCCHHPSANRTRRPPTGHRRLRLGLGIPAKLILFDRRVENHRVSEETEAAIAAYLQSNELDSVKVRLNQYRPNATGNDWSPTNQLAPACALHARSAQRRW
jgi:hypothetical protein